MTALCKAVPSNLYGFLRDITAVCGGGLPERLIYATFLFPSTYLPHVCTFCSPYTPPLFLPRDILTYVVSSSLRFIFARHTRRTSGRTRRMSMTAFASASRATSRSASPSPTASSTVRAQSLAHQPHHGVRAEFPPTLSTPSPFLGAGSRQVGGVRRGGRRHG